MEKTNNDRHAHPRRSFLKSMTLGCGGMLACPALAISAADREVEELIRARIEAARPQDAILGEEGGASGGTSGITWLVDPIDGTVNYLYGIPAYAVSVAAVVGPPRPTEWTVVAGCVHSVADGRTWTATLGGGAYEDGRRVRVNPPAPLAESLLADPGQDPALLVGQHQQRIEIAAHARHRDRHEIVHPCLEHIHVAEGVVVNRSCRRLANPQRVGALKGAHTVSGQHTEAGRADTNEDQPANHHHIRVPPP